MNEEQNVTTKLNICAFCGKEIKNDNNSTYCPGLRQESDYAHDECLYTVENRAEGISSMLHSSWRQSYQSLVKENQESGVSTTAIEEQAKNDVPWYQLDQEMKDNISNEALHYFDAITRWMQGESKVTGLLTIRKRKELRNRAKRRN